MPLPTLLRLHVLLLSLGVALAVLSGCADPPVAADAQAGADGVEPDPREPDDLALKSGLSCHPRSASGYTAGARRAITVVDVDGRPVEINTAARFLEMQADAQAAGVSLYIVSGFRTMEEQQYLYGCYLSCNCNNCNLAASPGYSNHQSGLALDLNTSDWGVYDWLARHGADYGFHRTVPSEDWHWEYLDGGAPGAGLCESGGATGSTSHGDLAFVGLTPNGAYRNGLWLKVKGGAHHVRYFADDVFLGASEDRAGGFPVRVTVQYLGAKTFVAKGYDAEDTAVAETRVTLQVVAGETPKARLKFISPADGGSFAGGMWLKVDAPASAVRAVYSAGPYALGESGVADDHFAQRVDLTTSGWRVLQAVVYDRDDTELGRAYTVIDFDAPAATVKFENVTEGNAYGREVVLRAATTGPVAAVEFFADRWSLGKVATGNSHAVLRYTFQQGGRRVLRAVALGTRGESLGEDTVAVDIVP
jgi:D-alanyl-D-alanine carboxypeptidase